ncbi:hypothetical protein CROQUDRAFT_135262 [Cronartium quercuum f. sp. fusiforme G11]|uniref:acylaminoacyl-peptidase n=1 Tax=Cronartium quercuum f. sp. fusiforme G11 TaxID=708437 RepID=A0A9P6T8E3_9BASI|nr:hypothetical protein CROQUDRAFT_135262 [Cronartium quercuum f. sp. fusiforme G11]
MASPDKDQSTSTHAQEIYTALASIPVITSATVCSTRTSSRIEVDYTIRDHVRLLKRRVTQAFQAIHPSKADAAPSQSPVLRGPLSEISSEVIWKAYSPNGQKRVILRASESARFIEIWDTATNELKRCHEVTEKHGKFIVNETFGYPSWDSKESCLAYVAESTNKPANPSFAHKHRYIADFGEQLAQIRLPALFLFLIDDDNCTAENTTIQVTNPSSASDVCYGQPVFGSGSCSKPELYQIICTGFASLPDGRRPGLIYCQNRPTAIYELSIKLTDPTKPLKAESLSHSTTRTIMPASVGSHRLSSSAYSGRSPRVLGERVYYISNPIGGPHGSCASLNVVSTSTGEEEVLVSVVEEPHSNAGNPAEDQFPGLYIDQLPLHPFLSNSATGDHFLVTSSIWGSLKVLLIIDLQTGKVQRYEGPGRGSCTVWNTNGTDSILASHSQTTQPPIICLGTLAANGSITWNKIERLQTKTKIEQQLSKTSTQVMKLPPNEYGPTEIVFTSGTSFDVKNISLSSEPLPVIIAPHGGPHSTSVNEFSPVTAAFALLGYSTAYINYPGSLGYGQKWVYHLIKHLGQADVESSKLALDFLRSSKRVHPRRAFVNGGSHGGFITAHLTSRYPDLFAAACMRNPVVDLVGTAAGGSDIPDWSFAEADLPFPLTGNSRAPVMIDEEAFRVLKSASPISQLDQVKTPTLLLLGDVDRRVSHQQGLAWYHGLQGRGIKSNAYMFIENSHPLSGIEAELASFEATFEHFST